MDDTVTNDLATLDHKITIDVPLYWQQWRIPSQTLTATGAAIETDTLTALRQQPR